MPAILRLIIGEPMRKSEVRTVLRKKFEAYRNDVIAKIKALPTECRQSGGDFLLEDVWEEFKYQVQGEESSLFDAYVETIEAICRQVLERLPTHELELFGWRPTPTSTTMMKLAYLTGMNCLKE